MKLRTPLCALAAAAIAMGAPALALAQAPSTGNGVVASSPVPNPPEKAATHKARHKTTKVSHRRHKAATTATTTKTATATKTPAKPAPMKVAAKTTTHPMAKK
jgi:hypothetical protein